MQTEAQQPLYGLLVLGCLGSCSRTPWSALIRSRKWPCLRKQGILSTLSHHPPFDTNLNPVNSSTCCFLYNHSGVVWDYNGLHFTLMSKPTTIVREVWYAGQSVRAPLALIEAEWWKYKFSQWAIFLFKLSTHSMWMMQLILFVT